ncbi:MAG: electron transport complex subunit E [Holophagae bacterium]|jgi:electron transport complex protein RnfE
MEGREAFVRALWQENPVLRLLLGLCPVLAVTTSVIDAAGMGLATTFVLVASSFVVSVIRGIVPRSMRIPIFIVVIATFVTMVDLLLQAYLYSLSKSLGLFVPLIVVNCMILGRAEAFASRNPVRASLADGLGMGLGFTLALLALGAVREVLGSGSLLGRPLVGPDAPTALLFVLPPGAFLTLGLLIWLGNEIEARRVR